MVRFEERHGFLSALLEETLRRVEEFPPQSLFDVHDALIFFKVMPSAIWMECAVFVVGDWFLSRRG
jgi:hypothetical protein